VRSSARGKKCVRKGARGLERSVAKMEPIIVSAVSSRVASAGEKSAPANTFQITLPGMDHACFHTDVMERTPMTCAIGPGPL
jgi:hypothetical protein